MFVYEKLKVSTLDVLRDQLVTVISACFGFLGYQVNVRSLDDDNPRVL